MAVSGSDRKANFKVEKYEEVEVLIVGAGPTGIGAAVRLHEMTSRSSECRAKQKKYNNFLLVESSSEPGGLASTVVTKEGFLFDLGGHVIFSHYEYFDNLLSSCVGDFDDRDIWAIHNRESYVYMQNTYIPYPFQLNFGHLPSLEDRIKCLNGLIDARVSQASRINAECQHCGTTPQPLLLKCEKKTKQPKHFDEWIEWTMGSGINNLFMKPYNFKVWAYPTTELAWSWLGERVAVVDTEEAVRNVLIQSSCENGSEKEYNRKKKGWGPNSTFAFPQVGGTGSIWKRVAQRAIPEEKQRYNTEVVNVDLNAKFVTIDDGSRIKYKKMISTIPLDCFLKMAIGHDHVNFDELAGRLRYSSSHIVGLGVRGRNPFKEKCWLYYPESNCPFYRCTIFSHYAEANCPKDDVRLPTLRLALRTEEADVESGRILSGPYHSLMFEISESTVKPVDITRVVDDTIKGAIAMGLLQPTSELVSIYHTRLEHGYPTPHSDRDYVLREVLPLLLETHDIYSRGRFGSWKYEVSNQDHSCMLGVEAVDNILFSSVEVSLDTPGVVNTSGAKQSDRKYYLGK